MKKQYLLALLLIVLSIVSCRKYVEIPQIGVRTLKYTSDYRALLNNNNLFEPTYGFPILSGDDTGIDDVTRQNNITPTWARVYTWADYYVDAVTADVDWDRLYNSIYNCNVVLDGVMSSDGGTLQLKQQLMGEALVHRAFDYWCLVNIYAKQYDAGTAQQDPGVPMLLTQNLHADLTRASVQTIYNQMSADLQKAIPYLPQLPDYNVRPSKAAAYAILAKINLFTQNYKQAALYADSTLTIKSGLLDLKTYVNNTSAIPQRLNDPEIILSKIVMGSYTGVPISKNLLQLLGTTDLRYSLFTKDGSQFSPSFTGRGYWRYRYTNEGIYVGPNVPEVMLIKAECAARAGDVNTTIALLNTLRRKRFNTADYTDIIVTNQTDALTKVIEERQRELFGRGLRWFDQKRLNKEQTFAQTVTRVFQGQTYTLAPNSNRYIYPIGQKYILLNPEIQQNPR